MNRVVAVLLGALLSATVSPALAAQCGSENAELIAVTNWSITKIDDRSNRLEVTITSRAEQPIRMLDASVGFADALGKEIARYAVDRDAAIPAKGDFTETGKWGPYTFERLLKLKTDEVDAYVCVRAVLYDDGSKEQFK